MERSGDRLTRRFMTAWRYLTAANSGMARKFPVERGILVAENLENPESVDKRRRALGFRLSLRDYIALFPTARCH